MNTLRRNDREAGSDPVSETWERSGSKAETVFFYSSSKDPNLESIPKISYADEMFLFHKSLKR